MGRYTRRLAKRSAVCVPCLVLVALVLASCGANEQVVSDRTAGLNGGFELLADGFPVNWAFAPNPASDDSYRISVDSSDRVEGNQSLRVTSSRGTSTKVFRSQRVLVETGKTYRIAYSVKGKGVSLEVRRTTMNSSGTTNIRSDIIGKLSSSSPDWVYQEEILAVAAGEAKVFLTFLVDGAGVLWCDDVRIEEEI